MTYQANKPVDSDIVSASVLNANFTAIEDGTVDSKQWTFSEQATAPTNTATTFILYSKEDTTAELFGKGEDNNEIQFSQDGALGGTGQAINFNTLSYDGTNTFNENNFVRAWASFPKTTSNGALTLTGGVGLTGTRTAQGRYTITITNALDAADYMVLPSCSTSSLGDVRTITWNTLAGGSFNVEVVDGGENYADEAFMVAIVGGTVA